MWGWLIAVGASRVVPQDPEPAPEPATASTAVTLCSARDPGQEGATFEPCENRHECGTGLSCAPRESVAACEGAFGSSCCGPNCDLEAPECAAPSVCIPVFSAGVMPIGLANIGDCGQEPR